MKRIPSYTLPVIIVLTVLVMVVAVPSCGPSRLTRIRQQQVQATLKLPEGSDIPELEYRQAQNDTLVVKGDDGQDILIMKAIKDEETGEMVANEVLQAAVVTARFRNIAERHGKIDLNFQVIVPADLQDSKWQTRFYPDMFIMEDSVRLEPVIITGEKYRKKQLRGYEQYERFLARIITDSTRWVLQDQLDRFIERNIPDVYYFKNDTSFVSDEVFYSFFGVSEQEALEHYTIKIIKRYNTRLLSRRRQMYEKYVKAPIVTDGIRLDTIIRNADGDFVYNYTQTINTRPKLRKVDIVLSGGVYDQDKQLYRVPRSEPLTFYISSLSSFTHKDAKQYIRRIVERRAEANVSYQIVFGKGRSDLQIDLGKNYEQVNNVKDNLADLMSNEIYDIDSIVVVSNASPEGSYEHNGNLSKLRGESVVQYFDAFVKEYRKKVERDAGFSIDIDGSIIRESSKIPSISFRAKSVPENWKLLDELVRDNEHLTETQKERYFSYSDIDNKDTRENRLKGEDFYKYMADTLYPRLRVVDFTFHLARKGMVKDTVITTELDKNYERGLQLLSDMDYDEAVKILGPYQDYNAAVAYMAADRNASAMLILNNLERTPQVNYLLAILYARTGKTNQAVQCYLDACAADRSYVNRGNLDPEISQLIKLYGLNRQDDYDDDLGY